MTSLGRTGLTNPPDEQDSTDFFAYHEVTRPGALIRLTEKCEIALLGCIRMKIDERIA